MTTTLPRAARTAGVVAVLLTVLFAVPFALGWLAGHLATAAGWLRAAVAAGYRAARPQAGER